MIRPGTLADMAEIRRINESAARFGTKGFYSQEIIDRWSGPFLDWYYPAIFEEHQPKSITHVCEQEKLHGVGRAIDNEIYFLFVDPQLIGQGIGSSLLQSLEKEIGRKHKTITVLSTLNAAPFYTKHGYTPIKNGGYDIGNGL